MEDDDVRLSSRALQERFQISDRTVDRWLADPRLNFPRPVLTINRRRFWSRAEIVAWERARAARAGV